MHTNLPPAPLIVLAHIHNQASPQPDDAGWRQRAGAVVDSR
jgi:hypothetical protein